MKETKEKEPTVRKLAERLVFTWAKTGTESRELLTDLIIAAILDDRERQKAPIKKMVDDCVAEIRQIAETHFAPRSVLPVTTGQSPKTKER